MLTSILKYLSPPIFEGDEEKTRAAKLLHQIILASWSIPPLTIIVSILNSSSRSIILPIGVVFLIILLILMYLNHNGQVIIGGILLISVAIILLAIVNYSGGGETRPALLLTVWVILLGGLLLGTRAPMLIAIILALINSVLVFLGARGLITPQTTAPGPIQNAIVATISYILIAFTLNLSTSRLQFTLRQVREREKELQESNNQLHELSASLETRVAERTAELSQRSNELAQQSLELKKNISYLARKTAQLEAISKVTNVIASIQNLEELLPRITTLISGQFDFYHVGIFLADEAREYAVLAAANSEGGQRMLNRGHRLRIGQVGIVGNVVGTGIPRVALDTGADAVFFQNPDLPGTRSEMALPLRAGNLIIGALDVQSTEPNAFSEEDVEVLIVLAEQVSIAIQNARQYEDTQKALAEAEAIYRQTLRADWKRFSEGKQAAGFRYSLLGTQEIAEIPLSEVDRQALENGALQMRIGADASTLAVPIKLRGEVIGIMNVRAPGGHSWNENELDVVQAVADRVALSAENARLFEETTSRAERERTVADITNKIRATNDPQEMINTALEELKRALNVSRVKIVPYASPNQNK